MTASTMERPSMGSDLPPNPTSLRPGSLVYLWAPEQPLSAPPKLIRVEKATMDTILGMDLTAGGGARGAYTVGPGRADAWVWGLAAEPATPAPTGRIEHVDFAEMSLDERAEFLFGPPGTEVRVRLRGTDTSILGVVSRLVIEDGEIRGIEITGPADSRGVIVHRIRYDQVAGTTLTGSGR